MKMDFNPNIQHLIFDHRGYTYDLYHTGSANSTVGFDMFVSKDGEPLLFNGFNGERPQLRHYILYGSLSMWFEIAGVEITIGNHRESQPEYFGDTELFPPQNRAGYSLYPNFPADIRAQIKAFIQTEYRRILLDFIEQIEAGAEFEKNVRQPQWLWASKVFGHLHTSALDSWTNYTMKELAFMFRSEESSRRNRAEEWDEREAKGITVVTLKRCWECGRTQITGQMLRGGRTQRMPRELYDEAVKEQAKAHENSRRTIVDQPGTIISIIGFIPNRDSKFEFVVIDDDWYCGC
jgi:hypothetical protein